VDTNRVVSSVGQDRSSYALVFAFGLILNLAQMVMTCHYIKIDRINAITIKNDDALAEEGGTAAADGDTKEAGHKKGGKKDGGGEGSDENEEYDDGEDDYDEADGKIFRKCNRLCLYMLKCRCFVGATPDNLITILFGVLMMINQIIKVFFEGAVNKMLMGDLTSDYVDFSGKMVFVEVMAAFDTILYFLLIVVINNVMFSWLPEFFGS